MTNFFQTEKDDVLIFPSFFRFLDKPPSADIFAEVLPSVDFLNAEYCDFPEIWYCRNGYYTHCTENGVFECSPGSVLIIPPGVMNCTRIQKGVSASVIRVSVKSDCYKNSPAEAYINSITRILLPCFSRELRFSPILFRVLSDKARFTAEHLFSSPSLDGLEQFFSLPEFKLPPQQRELALLSAKTRLYPLLHVLSHMSSNYSQKITAENLCDVSSLCRTNLFSMFKRYLGISPSSYLAMLRVRRAQFAIAHTQYSLQYISDMCGFTSSSYMSKCYKRYKGFLPKLDRANIKLYQKRYPNIRISHDYFSGNNDMENQP